MAQRTAFLNSDAKGFNKDFHHTWINNYMLKQPGVMFSNYSTKPEFALGNGQIAGGKAIIRCTRTTGTFAGEEILACFESTSTENISTAGNKKVYIEIPEVYVNDSTAITDSLTQGANLNVGRIVSSDSYPTHSNYIPLWEISNGDWQNATDLRPEVLRRGKPNTISYFGGNGEEERIDIDNASLNKYLMSNGAGMAPSREEGGGGGGGGSSENFRRTFTADLDLPAKSMFGVAQIPGMADVDSAYSVGRYGGLSQNAFGVILNGEDFSSLTLKLAAINSPADTLSVRVETVDANGIPTGTLVDVGAYGTATPTGTEGNVVVSLAGTVSGLTAHTRAAVVIARTGAISSSNYFTLGTCTDKLESYAITKLYVLSGSAWTIAGTNCGCVECDGFATEAVVPSKSSVYAPSWLGYTETGANAGNDFTGILQGTFEYEGATTGTKYYVNSNSSTLTTTKRSEYVGKCVIDGVIELAKIEESVSGSNISLIATENINQGDLVSFDGVGAKNLRRGFYGTADTGITLTSNSQEYQQIDSTNIGNNTVVVVYKYGNNNVFVVAIKHTGENRTVGTPLQINTANAGTVSICSPYEGEFVVNYRGGDSKVYAVAGSVNGVTITKGSETLIYSSTGVSCSRITKRFDSNNRSFILFYNDSEKIWYNICTYTSGLVITAGTTNTLRNDTTLCDYFSATYIKEGYAAIVYDYAPGGSDTKHHIKLTYANVSTNSLTQMKTDDVFSADIEDYSIIWSDFWGATIVPVTKDLILIDTNVLGIGLILVKVFGTNLSYRCIDVIEPNLNYPIGGRRYCTEDIDNGIIGLYGEGWENRTMVEMYKRYKGTETGLECIYKKTNGSVANPTGRLTVTRIDNMSCCVRINNNKLYNLLFEDESDSYVGISNNSTTSGNKVDVVYNGVVTKSGLTSGKPIYIGFNGTVETYGTKQIGVALSSTQALLK